MASRQEADGAHKAISNLEKELQVMKDKYSDASSETASLKETIGKMQVASDDTRNALAAEVRNFYSKKNRFQTNTAVWMQPMCTHNLTNAQNPGRHA